MVTPAAPGKATIKITAAETGEYEKAEKTVTITVKPKKTITTGSAALGNRRIKITWKRDSKVDGYQIMYARNKSFSLGVKYKTATGNRTVSKVFTGLSKGKTYYFRVRAYKKSGTSKIYGSWSSYRYRTCR